MIGLTETQLRHHQTHITGSKVASIIGVDDAFMSRFRLFSLMSGYQPWPEEESERLKAGQYMELSMHAWCEGEYGWKLQHGPSAGKFHPNFNFLYGLVDRIKYDNGVPSAVVEFKNVDNFMADRWSDGVPLKYQAQVYFYQLLWDLPTAWVVACFGGNRFEKYELPRDKKVEDFILQQCIKFWDDLKAERWPEPDASDDCAKTLAQLFDQPTKGMMAGDHDAFMVAKEYEAINKNIKQLETQKTKCGNRLKYEIGNNQGILFPDHKSKVTWKMTTPKKEKFNEEKFKKAHKELHEKFTFMPSGYRRLNVSIKE